MSSALGSASFLERGYSLAAGEALELETRQRGLFGSHGLLMTLVIGFGGLLLGGATVLCWCDRWGVVFEGKAAWFKHELGALYVASLLLDPPLLPLHGVAKV